MRLGLFGGSFDPLHAGHVEPVKEARQVLSLDRVVCLPTASPPHKPGDRVAPARARFTMAELAWLDEPAVEVSDFEMTMGRTAYTIDSIEHFSALHPQASLMLLIGWDSYLELPLWHRWEEIVAGVDIGVLTRPGFTDDDRSERLPEPLLTARRDGRVHFVPNRPLEVSSTELRRRLAEGEEIPDQWVPPLVLKYLRKYPNLYA